METPLITIDFKTYTLGESKSNRIADRGFSPESYGLNLLKEEGTLYFSGGTTDLSASLEGDVVCTANDPDFLGQDAYILDNEGKFYTLSGTTLTKRQTDSVKTYQVGTSDMVRFKGSLFATSQTDIAKVDGGDLTAGVDNDWWTTTRAHSALQSSYRHPLEVVEDTLYIGDKNFIHTWDGTTSVAEAMTLPYYINVVTLRKHPDGRHLIAFCGVTANYSHTRNGGGKIYVIDTLNLEFVREIDTEAQVEGSRNVGGIVYVTYGDRLGYFNGDGLEELRKLTNGSTTYSHQLSNAENILLVRDGKDVLAYGDLGQGKVWWRPYRANAGSYSTFTAIGYKGDDTILVAYVDATSGAEQLYQVALNTAGIVGIFESNHYLPGGHVAVRRIEIDHTATPASGYNAFYVRLYDGVGNQLHNQLTEYTNNVQSMTRIDLDAFAYDIQLELAPSNGAMGFRQIRIYGESIE